MVPPAMDRTAGGGTGAEAVAAVVLAAGLSRRMGAPKMVLPWGNTTVIAQVTRVLRAAGAGRVIVVTGGAREQVEAALRGEPVHCVFNPDFESGDMARSLQVGLTALPESFRAALVALGDQPQIEAWVARRVLETYLDTRAPLVAPSYAMHRGHPWLIDRRLWPEVQALGAGQMLRDVFGRHRQEIHYIPVDTPSVLQDLDTPEDYRRLRPEPPDGPQPE